MLRDAVYWKQALGINSCFILSFRRLADSLFSSEYKTSKPETWKVLESLTLLCVQQAGLLSSSGEEGVRGRPGAADVGLPGLGLRRKGRVRPAVESGPGQPLTSCLSSPSLGWTGSATQP